MSSPNSCSIQPASDRQLVGRQVDLGRLDRPALLDQRTELLRGYLIAAPRANQRLGDHRIGPDRSS